MVGSIVEMQVHIKIFFLNLFIIYIILKGELSSRLVEDLDLIKEGIGAQLAEFLSIIARVIASVIYSLYTGWKLTLVFLSISPLIILSIALLIKVCFDNFLFSKNEILTIGNRSIYSYGIESI